MTTPLVIFPYEMDRWLKKAKPCQRCAFDLLCAYLDLWDRRRYKARDLEKEFDALTKEFEAVKAAPPFVKPTIQEASALMLWDQKVRAMFAKQPEPWIN